MDELVTLPKGKIYELLQLIEMLFTLTLDNKSQHIHDCRKCKLTDELYENFMSNEPLL